MTTETTDTHSPSTANTPLALKLTEGLGPLVEPVTLADVLDALNVFNRPKPSEDDGPWEGGHFIRVDHLPAFINVIAAAWFARTPLTDEQVAEACGWKAGLGCMPLPRELRIARAIERAHGIGPNFGGNRT